MILWFALTISHNHLNLLTRRDKLSPPREVAFCMCTNEFIRQATVKIALGFENLKHCFLFCHGHVVSTY